MGCRKGAETLNPEWTTFLDTVKEKWLSKVAQRPSHFLCFRDPCRYPRRSARSLPGRCCRSGRATLCTTAAWSRIRWQPLCAGPALHRQVVAGGLLCGGTLGAGTAGARGPNRGETGGSVSPPGQGGKGDIVGSMEEKGKGAARRSKEHSGRHKDTNTKHPY